LEREELMGTWEMVTEVWVVLRKPQSITSKESKFP